MPHRVQLHLIVIHGKHLAMSFIVARNFLCQQGKHRLDKIKELSNKPSPKRGKQKRLKEIAEYLGVSIQRASKLRSQLFEQQWVYSQATLDALKLEKSNAEDTATEIDEMLEKDKVLVFRERKQA